MVVKMSFHLDILSSFGIQAAQSEAEIESVETFERLHAIKLPASVREWYCLDNWPGILKQITRVPHRPVLLAEVDNFLFTGHADWDSSQPLAILEENQGVWHMAIELNGHPNPPVLVRYNEPAESWHHYADSFSDWIFAWLWDNAVI
ncbi:MAG: SMI1/KNR4 family protein, partial [Anaerolineales bacterium]|nr:SMI1/KNR4 family protein [Anaerolineales bacterium]